MKVLVVLAAFVCKYTWGLEVCGVTQGVWHGSSIMINCIRFQVSQPPTIVRLAQASGAPVAKTRGDAVRKLIALSIVGLSLAASKSSGEPI